MTENKNEVKKTKQYFKNKALHEVKIIDVKKIRLNDYNPNEIDDKVMDQLEQRIREEGFLQPIIVRKIEPKDGKEYEMIDGEHRYIIAVERIGYEYLPAYVLDKDLPDAMIDTINMNKLRGEFDTLKLAEVVHQLNKTYSMEELESKLGYSRDELTGLQDLLDFDFDEYREYDLDDVAGVNKDILRFPLEISLTKDQDEIVKKAIEKTEKEDNAEAITEICSFFLENG